MLLPLPVSLPRRAVSLAKVAVVAALAGAAVSLAAPAARAQDHLLFCNNPEKMRMTGAYGDSRLKAGETYLIFYHYKNVTGSAANFVVALHGEGGKPLRFTARQGTADPRRDPPSAGRQAMARYLSAPERPMLGRKGYARFAHKLANRAVTSGVLSVRCESDARLRLYLNHDKWDVPGASVVSVTAPRREIEIALSASAKQQYYRIGEPEPGMHRALDGTYGMLYAFKVAAPAGRKVRVSFSPRGGKGGMVGSVNGTMRQSSIVPATHWRVFCETVVGKNGMILTTAPFGGVFYPVELQFRLL